MNYKYILFLASFILGGCELIVIGVKKPKPIEISQYSPLGAALLFKNELDSNNIFGAVRLIAAPGGTKYLAAEKFDMYDDIERIGRIISDKPVTNINADSNVALNPQVIAFELNYMKKISFTLYKINDYWYVTGISEQYNSKLKTIN